MYGFNYFYKYWIEGHFKGRKMKQDAVFDYLYKFYGSDFFNFNLDINDKINNEYKQTIWVCWWQGEEQMPDIVKCCYNSLIKHRNNHAVILITKNNYESYITLPKCVCDNFLNGNISITHLTDIIRVSILCKHGGLWVDSTLYFTEDLPSVFPSFYTIKQECKDDSYASNYLWTGFFIGGDSQNLFFEKIRDMLELYWSKHCRLINYYLLDYIIMLLYRHDFHIKAMIDNIPYSNPNINFLQNHLNSRFCHTEWARIILNTSIFKLSWKQSYIKYDNFNNCTYYGYLTSN